VSFRRKAGAKKETAPLRQGAVGEICWQVALAEAMPDVENNVDSTAREGDRFCSPPSVGGPAGTDSGTLARGHGVDVVLAPM
jgi:hypothetical protein